MFMAVIKIFLTKQNQVTIFIWNFYLQLSDAPISFAKWRKIYTYTL